MIVNRICPLVYPIFYFKECNVNIANILVWIIGFIVYRKFIQIDTVLGSTVPVMIVVSILCLLVNYFKKFINKKL